MEPEEVAGEENLILDKERDLGFGPVSPRRDKEPERPVPERQGLPVGDNEKPFLRDVQEGYEQIAALCICDHPCVRVELQDHGECAGVILLCMVDHNIVDAFGAQLDQV